MGVDICMFVLPTEVLTDQERRLLSAEIASRVDADWFAIHRTGETDILGDRDTHVLMPVDTDMYYELEDVDGLPDGLLEINTYGRYYGPGYERGNWLNIKTTAEILEALSPGCRIWYGGDSGETLACFDAAQRQSIHDHFLQHGYAPYRNYKGAFASRATQQHCDHCGGREMNHSGGGGGQEFWSCDGCGYQIIVQPGDVKTPVPSGKHFFEVSRTLPLRND